MTAHPAGRGRAMVCPVCAPRYAKVVDAGCPVCRGLGALVLTAKMVDREPVAVVARAVELYLHEFSSAYLAGRIDGWEALRLATEALVDAEFIVPLPPWEDGTAPALELAQDVRAQYGRRAARIARELGADAPTEERSTDIITMTGTTTSTHQAKVMPLDELAARRRTRASGQ